MKTLTFSIDLDAAPNCTAEALVQGDRAEVTRVTDSSGNPVPVSLDDLDRIEEHIFPEETTFELPNPFTGTPTTYTVHHDGERIGKITDPFGFSFPRHAEEFTEIAEVFHIDRQWAMMEESDVQGYARRCYC